MICPLIQTESKPSSATKIEKGNGMNTFFATHAVAAVVLALTGLLIQSRMNCNTYFKQWMSQFFGAAFYCAGFFLMSTSSYVWLATTNGWQNSSGSSMSFVTMYLPAALSFITALVVEIRHRDFGASSTAIVLGSVSGWTAIVASLQFMSNF